MKTSLIALDGSPNSEFVLQRAEMLAQVFTSKLVLIRVIETDSHGLTDAVQNRLAMAQALAYLGTVAAGPRERGLQVEIDVGIGDPAAEILRVAGVRGVDLVVLGPNRAPDGGGEPGGTALKVAARCGTSLLMVRPNEAVEGAAPLGKVMAAIDGSPSGDWAAFHGAAIASALGAQLLLVHAMAEPELMGAPAATAASELAAALVSANRAEAVDHLDRLCRQLRQPGLRIDTALVQGPSAARCLQTIIEDEGVDLAVVGAQGWHADPRRSHGPVADALLLSSRISVLLCQHAPRHQYQNVLEHRGATRPERLRYARAG